MQGLVVCREGSLGQTWHGLRDEFDWTLSCQVHCMLPIEIADDYDDHVQGAFDSLLQSCSILRSTLDD